MSLETINVKLNGKDYTITEPTIEVWSRVMKLKDIFDEEELYIRLISELIGISKDEVLKMNSIEIIEVGDYIYKFINADTKKLYPEIELNGIEYSLVDVQNVSFGQYVDIDSFLRKDETYRIANLNELAAYLYTEKGKNYGDTDIKKRIQSMNQLPIRYVESSIFFLLNLARGSQKLIQLYSQNKFLWWIMKQKITLALIGDGIRQYQLSRKTKFGRLIISLTYPLLYVLTICLMLLTKTKKEKG
jgi:hypothetical protein